MPVEIDWERVKNISVHLKKWMEENNYELIDIERACSYIKAPRYVPPYRLRVQGLGEEKP